MGVMHKYAVRVERKSTDVGYIYINANSAEEAVRKYYQPVAGVDGLVFDDEIDWEYGDYEYNATAEEGDWV